jgi:hypothetical protein
MGVSLSREKALGKAEERTMSETILDPREASYLIKKAELIKTFHQIEQSVSALTGDLVGSEEPKSHITYVNTGKELKIDISLDSLTPDRFDIIIPYFKKHLEEYHQLRKRQKELEEELTKEKRPHFMDVVDHRDIKIT